MLLKNLLAALVPLALVAVTLWAAWWYVVIHQEVAPAVELPRHAAASSPSGERLRRAAGASDRRGRNSASPTASEPPASARAGDGLEQLGTPSC